MKDAYHSHEPKDEDAANAWLMNFLLRYNDMQHRSEPHSIDRRSVLTGSVARDLLARVAVAVRPREVAARDLQPEAVARRNRHRGPQRIW
jgi:hypothetical protein